MSDFRDERYELMAEFYDMYKQFCDDKGLPCVKKDVWVNEFFIATTDISGVMTLSEYWQLEMSLLEYGNTHKNSG